MHIRPYQKLIVWKEAHALCLAVYKLTADFPSQERFRLVDQICRAASSVPMNISEGASKRSPRERFRYYETALSSLEELHYQCVLSKDLRYITESDFAAADDHIQRISYLLVHLQRSLR